MTPAAFAARAVGLPWVRWRSDWTACDCFGLVVLYYREVHGIDLGEVPQTDIGAGFEALRARWQECGPEPGASAFMSFDGEGAPRHCGLLIDGGRLLHAEGGIDLQGRSFGSVRLSRLAAWSRLYLDTRFYRLAEC